MRGQGLWGVCQSRVRTRLESGAVAVEFALVLPILVMLVFGIFTTGLAYSDHLAVTNAVREGARFGSAIDYHSAPTTWAESVRTRVQQTYFNAASSLTDDQVCVELVNSAGTAIASPTTQGANCGTVPAPPSPMVPGTCAVLVWASKPETISVLVYSDMNFDIGADSVSYYGRNAGSCKATP